jgi:hypothetical protein
MNDRAWLTTPQMDAVCLKLGAEREAEEAQIRERFEKWATAHNWNLTRGMQEGMYDHRAVDWGYIAFRAAARGEA